jgi:HEPN domain-containing protein
MEEILNKRAKLFLKEAENDIKNGFFDLAAFHLEQALQLKLKYILAKKIGYFSRAHISTLFEEVKKSFQKFLKFIRNIRKKLKNLKLHILEQDICQLSTQRKKYKNY